MKEILFFLLLAVSLQAQDTIPITAAHQKLLPELLQEVNRLNEQQKQVNEKIMILILGYLTDEKHLKALQENRVSFSKDGKSLVIVEKKAE